MLVVVDGDQIKLPIEDVLYFFAEKKYIVAVSSRRSFKLASSLDAIEQEYPSLLWRVHRKYLVKGEVVDGLIKIEDTLFLDIAGATEPIPVSRRESPKVRRLFRARA